MINPGMLRREILSSLNRCGNYALVENTLIQEIQVTVAPPPSRSEILEQIKWLESQNYIAGRRADFDGAMRWKITTEGQLEL
jgi:hypothetical protein